jgi:hypothetical protein
MGQWVVGKGKTSICATSGRKFGKTKLNSHANWLQQPAIKPVRTFASFGLSHD